MAEGETLKSPQQIDQEAFDKYNRILKQSLDREAKLHQQWEWRGNRLPPFNIEPLPGQRERLAGAGMTAEQRAQRKLWLQDQRLSPNEPRFVPELYPKNAFRRALGMPWNFLFNNLKPILGEARSGKGRYYVPKAAMGFAFLCACWYHVKYHPSHWTAVKGWHISESKDVVLPGDTRWPIGDEKQLEEFYDKGFRERQVLLNYPTSSA